MRTYECDVPVSRETHQINEQMRGLMVLPGVKHFLWYFCSLLFARGPRTALPDELAHAADAEPISMLNII